MMAQPPRLPQLPAEQELHYREQAARERIRKDKSIPLAWYLALAVAIIVLLALLVAYVLH